MRLREPYKPRPHIHKWVLGEVYPLSETIKLTRRCSECRRYERATILIAERVPDSVLAYVDAAWEEV